MKDIFSCSQRSLVANFPAAQRGLSALLPPTQIPYKYYLMLRSTENTNKVKKKYHSRI
jgi:hypothetical protein